MGSNSPHSHVPHACAWLPPSSCALLPCAFSLPLSPRGSCPSCSFPFPSPPHPPPPLRSPRRPHPLRRSWEEASSLPLPPQAQMDLPQTLLPLSSSHEKARRRFPM